MRKFAMKELKIRVHINYIIFGKHCLIDSPTVVAW